CPTWRRGTARGEIGARWGVAEGHGNNLCFHHWRSRSFRLPLYFIIRVQRAFLPVLCRAVLPPSPLGGEGSKSRDSSLPLAVTESKGAERVGRNVEDIHQCGVDQRDAAVAVRVQARRLVDVSVHDQLQLRQTADRLQQRGRADVQQVAGAAANDSIAVA